MKKNCLLFVFDGFSDCEVAYATVGIRKSETFQLKTIGLTKEPVVTMGGLNLTPDLDFRPDVDLADIDADNTGMLILPGGAMWEERALEDVTPLVAHCLLNGIPVAAICGATVFLADLGILNRTDHTSNDVHYLAAASPVYRGRAHYRMEPAVMTPMLITAGGAAPIEFANCVFERLDIRGQEPVNDWFQYFDKALTFTS